MTQPPSLRPPAVAQTRRDPSGRTGLQGLFLAALLGVLLAVGVGVVALTGWIGGAAYSVVLGGLLAAAISRRPREQAHQGCDCCAKAAAEPAPAGTIKL